MTKTTATSTTSCCTKIGIKKGPWSAEEDEILANFVHREGEGRWRTLPKRAGLQRCGKSCRLRWMNYLRPSVKRGQIAPDEEDLILRLHRLLGNRWALIAGRLPGRTDNEIKNYWNTHLSKKLIKRGIDPRTHKPLVINNTTNNNNSTTITTTVTSNGVVLNDSQKVGYNHHHHHLQHDRCSIITPLPPQQPMTVVNPASEIGNVINNSKFDYVPTISAGGGDMEEYNNNAINDATDDESIVFYHEKNNIENHDTAEEDTLMVFLNSLFDGNNNTNNNEAKMNNSNENNATATEEELAEFQHYYHHHHGEHDHDATIMFPPPVSTSFRLEDWEAEFSNALMNQQDASSSPPPSIK